MFICDRNDDRYACSVPEKIIVDRVDEMYVWNIKFCIYDNMEFEEVQEIFEKFWYLYDEHTGKVTNFSNYRDIAKYEVHYRENLTSFIVVQLAKELLI